MMRALRTRTWLRAGLLATLIAGGAVPATAHAAPSNEGLVVTPGAALFDVLLVPGQAESRLLTLTNTTDRPLDVYLTAELAPHSSPDHHFDDIVVHTDVTSTCEGVQFDPRRQMPLSQVNNAQQTVIPPRGSQNICVTAMVPWEVGSNKASTIVHLNFDAIQEPGDLATTGVQPPYLLLLIAVLLAITGWFLALRRRQLQDTTHTGESATADSETRPKL